MEKRQRQSDVSARARPFPAWMPLFVALLAACRPSAAPVPAPAGAPAQAEAPASEPTTQPATEEPPEPDAAEEGLLPEASLEQIRLSPGLLEHLRADPYSYFRFVNVPFAIHVCEEFGHPLAEWPTVNLHGDVHLEQYAVTVDGRGLSDFDNASTGPAALDLARFGSSVVIACGMRGWDEAIDELLSRFLDGYVSALHDPTLEVPAPAWAQRVHASFEDDRGAFLNWADALMEPLEAERARQLIEVDFPDYQEQMRLEYAELPVTFFDPVHFGRLETGLGSRLDTKFLIRIQGPSPDPADDIILEVKEVRDLSAIPCIRDPGGGGALRVLLGQSRISTLPSDFLGQLPDAPTEAGPQRPFWVQRWFARYLELDVDLDPTSVEELAEIVYDVGAQLGRGHTNQIGEPMGYELRTTQQRLVGENRAELIAIMRQLAELSLAGWETFKRASE